MNCLEFRRLYLIDPKTRTEDFIAHKRDCARCSSFITQQEALELQLHRALDIDVPQGLSARILLKQTTHAAQRHRSFALAASVILTLSVLTGLWFWPQGETLDHTVLAHIAHEPEALTVTETLAADRVKNNLQPLVHVRQPIADVRYASICKIREHNGAHLVMAGEEGPVTVLLMPGERLDRTIKIERRDYHGIIVPTADGSLAVVGHPGEDLVRIVETIQARLTVVF